MGRNWLLESTQKALVDSKGGGLGRTCYVPSLWGVEHAGRPMHVHVKYLIKSV